MPDGLVSSATVLAGDLAAATRNVCMMHVLERVAARFNQAGVRLMVLKGAALNLTLYARPDERPMSDLDLLVRPADVDRAVAVVEALGAVRGEPLVRDGFFPRFHYETEYKLGEVLPVRIDLHVRPFRPLRYSRLVPADAFWERADPVRIGRATVWVPSPEEMLIHLAVHSAVHGNPRQVWLADIKRWADAHQSGLDWDRFLDAARAWGLTLPVEKGIGRTERACGPVCPPGVMRLLAAECVGWRDRLALDQAPRDAAHPLAHIAVDFICTPGWRFPLAYVWAVAMPGPEHMGQWYTRRHRGWLTCAHLLRLSWPIVGRIPRLCERLSKIRTAPGRDHGTGVFAKQGIEPGELIARCRGKAVRGPTKNPGWQETRFGRTRRYELVGRLKRLNHSDRPNARLSGRRLVAIQPISANEEITIDHREAMGDPDVASKRTAAPSSHPAGADAA